MELYTAQFYRVTTKGKILRALLNQTRLTQSLSHYLDISSLFYCWVFLSFLIFRFVDVFVFLEASRTGLIPIGYSEHVVQVTRQMALTAVSSYHWIQKNTNRVLSMRKYYIEN
jgi:hypothetical protein